MTVENVQIWMSLVVRCCHPTARNLSDSNISNEYNALDSMATETWSISFNPHKQTNSTKKECEL